MPRTRVIGLALAVLITLLAVYGVAGYSRLSGPLLVKLVSTHGVHRNDVLVLLGWAVGMGLCWLLVRDDSAE